MPRSIDAQLANSRHPDGGIARVRAWGDVARDFATELAAGAVGELDLLSALNGGRAVGCSNKHYGEPRNLLRPPAGISRRLLRSAVTRSQHTGCSGSE